MITGLLQLAQTIARDARHAARATLWQTAALLVALIGAGFILAGLYSALHGMAGPVGAGLILGAVLIALATALWLRPRADHLQRPAPVQPPPAAAKPVDPVSTAVFAAGFVLGRILADRTRD